MMSDREKKFYKAVYFDLSTRALEENYSRQSPQNAYHLIRNFFKKRSFPMSSIQDIILHLKQQIYMCMI